MDEIIITIDGGGTGTKFFCAARGKEIDFETPGSNFQTIGVAAARNHIERGLERALSELEVRGNDVAAVVYGLAGADREKDFETVHGFLSDIHPGGAMLVVNDTLLALYAARADGVGVACIAGTGTNCIGQNTAGRIEKIGGLGSWMGDFGCGEDLTIAAASAAARFLDGRGPTTILADEICARLALREFEDIIEFGFFDREGEPLSLAPLVFDCANKGDAVAIEILEHAGFDAGDRASIILSKLFADDDEKIVVLGGSIFQLGSSPRMIDALTSRVRERHPAVKAWKLAMKPATGGPALFRDYKRRGRI
ncbi:MAG: hypothetical protein NUW37_15990 [Planctomycetes bacterium]|nr:hypothetical protein [Planctomycetota bacterium]